VLEQTNSKLWRMLYLVMNIFTRRGADYENACTTRSNKFKQNVSSSTQLNVLGFVSPHQFI